MRSPEGDTHRRAPGAPRATSRLLRGLAVYFEAAKKDRTLRLSKAAIAMGSGVDVKTLRLYAELPEVARWLARFASLQSGRSRLRDARAALLAEDDDTSGQALSSPPGETLPSASTESMVPMSASELDARIAGAIRDVSGDVQRFLGKRRRPMRDVHDIVLVNYDLDELLSALHAQKVRLVRLEQEYRRQHGMQARGRVAASVDSAQAELDVS